MEIPVVIEPVAGNGYRAKTGDLLGLTAEAGTADEALRALRTLVTQRVASGTQLVQLTVPGTANPWKRVAGMFENDPLFDEWQQAIAERRREMENDPDVP
jgi:hypothetical protein